MKMKEMTEIVYYLFEVMKLSLLSLHYFQFHYKELFLHYKILKKLQRLEFFLNFQKFFSYYQIVFITFSISSNNEEKFPSDLVISTCEQVFESLKILVFIKFPYTFSSSSTMIVALAFAQPI